jgi:hypothetical protein
MKIYRWFKDYKLKRNIKNTNNVLFEAKTDYALLFPSGVFTGIYKGVYIHIIFDGRKVILHKEINQYVENIIKKRIRMVKDLFKEEI